MCCHGAALRHALVGCACYLAPHPACCHAPLLRPCRPRLPACPQVQSWMADVMQGPLSQQGCISRQHLKQVGVVGEAKPAAQPASQRLLGSESAVLLLPHQPYRCMQPIPAKLAPPAASATAAGDAGAAQLHRGRGAGCAVCAGEEGCNHGGWRRNLPVQLTDGSGLPPVVYPIHLQIQHSARRPASTTVVLSHQPWHIGQPPAARGRFDFRQLFQPCLPPSGRLHVFTTQGMPAAWRHHTLHCTDCMKEAQFVCLHAQRKLAKHEAKRKRAIQASRGHEGQMSAGRRGRNSVKSVAMGLAAAVLLLSEEAWVIDGQEASPHAVLAPAVQVFWHADLRAAVAEAGVCCMSTRHTQQAQRRCKRRGRDASPAAPLHALSSPLTLQSAQAERQVPIPPPLLPRMKPALVLHSPAAAQSAQRSSASRQSSGTSSGSGACCTVSCSGRKGRVWIQKMAAGCRASRRGREEHQRVWQRHDLCAAPPTLPPAVNRVVPPTLGARACSCLPAHSLTHPRI